MRVDRRGERAGGAQLWPTCRAGGADDGCPAPARPGPASARRSAGDPGCRPAVRPHRDAGPGTGGPVGRAHGLLNEAISSAWRCRSPPSKGTRSWSRPAPRAAGDPDARRAPVLRGRGAATSSPGGGRHPGRSVQRTDEPLRRPSCGVSRWRSRSWPRTRCAAPSTAGARRGGRQAPVAAANVLVETWRLAWAPDGLHHPKPKSLRCGRGTGRGRPTDGRYGLRVAGAGHRRPRHRRRRRRG